MSELHLIKEFYIKDCIEKARNDFKELADIAVEMDREYYMVRFTKCRYPAYITIKEFENYVIGLMAKQ